MRGTATKVLQNLKLPITVQAVLDKFDVVFGTVLCDEELLSDYYSTSQRSTETVLAWACHLESHLYRFRFSFVLDSSIA